MMTGDKGFIANMWSFLFGEKPKDLRPSQPVAAVKTDLRALPSDKDWIVWFGHSSYLLHFNGKSILVDPVFYDAAPVSFVNRPFKGTDIYKPSDMPDIDYLVISHDHWDHLDYKAVTELRNRTNKVICPLGVGEHFERWGFPTQKLIELDWNESAALAHGMKANCLPARHFSGRGLKRNQSLWASFVIESPAGNIFIGGDSGYGRHFKEIGRRFPGLRLAIIENGQYSPNWRYIHTMPEHLADVMRDLSANRYITVHHSKYALANHPWEEPLGNEKTAAQKDSANLSVLTIGVPEFF